MGETPVQEPSRNRCAERSGDWWCQGVFRRSGTWLEDLQAFLQRHTDPTTLQGTGSSDSSEQSGGKGQPLWHNSTDGHTHQRGPGRRVQAALAGLGRDTAQGHFSFVIPKNFMHCDFLICTIFLMFEIN